MSQTAIVILNWNGKHFLEKFLPSLINRTPSTRGCPSKIFIADNGSSDGSQGWLAEHYPEIEVIPFDNNYGFTGGYNRALKELGSREEKFDYYLLLNSDVEVAERWFVHLFEFMESHPEIGICAPKVLSYANPEYFEHAGACGGLIDMYGFPYCRGRVLSRIERDKGQYDTPADIFWASGTSLMIRRTLWERLGGFDESFFAHMEEIDLCWRAKLLGEQVWVVPKSLIYHVGGGTLPNNSPRKLYLNFRNNLLMLYKNLPRHSKRRIIFVRMCIDGVIALIYLITGKKEFYRSVLDAHKDYKKMKGELVISEVITPVPRPKKFIAFL